MKLEKQVRNFQLIAGQPALDLVNTLDWRFRAGEPEELLASYGDLVGFAAQLNLLTARQARQLLRAASEKASASVLGAARELREALAAVLYATKDGRKPGAGPVKTLERCFNVAHAHRELGWDAGRLQWSWTDAEGAPDLPLWQIALSAEQLITSDELASVRECGDPECRWLFLDTSKNHTRRWCDMKLCGNRMKARRFKAQRRAEV
jgi:predicted RNA-binding Zn ribbon-like protein